MKKIIMIFGRFAIILIAFWRSPLGEIPYITRYKVEVVDTAQSADGVYEVILEEVAGLEGYLV